MQQMQQLTDSNSLHVRPTMNIRDVKPLSDEDGACMAEVAAVLKRYGCLDRFGMTLLHEHFTTATTDEVMLETNDPVARTLLIRPVPKSELQGVDSVVTSCQFLQNEPRLLRVNACANDGSHRRGDDDLYSVWRPEGFEKLLHTSLG